MSTTGRIRTQPLILRLFMESRGMEIWIDDLMEETKLNTAQIQSAIARLIKNGYDIRPILRGKTWRYYGEAKAATPKLANSERTVLAAVPPVPPRVLPDIPAIPRRALYEEVGITSDGTIIVQSENGVLFRLGAIV